MFAPPRMGEKGSTWVMNDCARGRSVRFRRLHSLLAHMMTACCQYAGWAWRTLRRYSENQVHVNSEIARNRMPEMIQINAHALLARQLERGYQIYIACHHHDNVYEAL